MSDKIPGFKIGMQPEPKPYHPETRTLLWMRLKRLVGLPTATSDHEGQFRYRRDGDVTGQAYVGRYTTGGTYSWQPILPIAPLVGVGYRDSASGNITSTTGTDLASLNVALTLTSGYTWDLFFEGSINSNAPAGDSIYAGCKVDGDIFGWTDTGTASGERALGFAGYKLGVVGDDASHTAYCHMKVGSGTGTINTGWAKLIAIPRT